MEPLSESLINLYPKRISPLFFLFPLNGLTKIPVVLRGFRPTNFFLFTLSNLLILSLSIAFSDHPSLTLFRSSLAYLAPIVHGSMLSPISDRRPVSVTKQITLVTLRRAFSLRLSLVDSHLFTIFQQGFSLIFTVLKHGN